MGAHQQFSLSMCGLSQSFWSDGGVSIPANVLQKNSNEIAASQPP
jgi:hypothetical protein